MRRSSPVNGAPTSMLRGWRPTVCAKVPRRLTSLNWLPIMGAASKVGWLRGFRQQRSGKRALALFVEVERDKQTDRGYHHAAHRDTAHRRLPLKLPKSERR